MTAIAAVHAGIIDDSPSRLSLSGSSVVILVAFGLLVVLVGSVMSVLKAIATNLASAFRVLGALAVGITALVLIGAVTLAPGIAGLTGALGPMVV